jgi:cobalt-precorrin-5B (C1)-methyltransferase
VGECLVVKDGGDDPDVTHRAEIGARVRSLETGEHAHGICLRGGEGVGQVTKPGLPVAVGEPAINPVPREMILRAVQEVLRDTGVAPIGGLEVEIFVPKGEALARHTLNARLGIVGGISILGTTGIVKPFSNEAYRSTVVSGLKVAKAVGVSHVVLSTGGKSERFAQELYPALPEEAFVQMGDYVRFSMEKACRMGFRDITVSGFFGKAVKMAQRFSHTHASKGAIRFEELSQWALDITKDVHLSDGIAGANTAREALDMIKRREAWDVVGEVGERMMNALLGYGVEAHQRLTVIIFDFSGSMLWRGQGKGRDPS